MVKKIKLTEEKKWSIFFEMLRRKIVLYILCGIVFSLGFILQYYDVKLLALRFLKFVFTH